LAVESRIVQQDEQAIGQQGPQRRNRRNAVAGIGKQRGPGKEQQQEFDGEEGH
jgi:hypothetical protein